MSHFTTLFVGDPDTIEEALEPFSEHIEAPAYWVGEAGDWSNDRGKVSVREWLETNHPDQVDAWDAYVESTAPVTVPTDDLNEALWAWWGHGGHRNLGGILQEETTYNPQSKWDWYEVGGRWDGFFINKDGEEVDSIRKGDIDFDAMVGRQAKLRREQWKAHQDGEKHAFLFQSIPESLEDYIGEVTPEYVIGTYSILFGGFWMQQGDMGWWGMDSNHDDSYVERSAELLRSLPDDSVLTILDLHI